MDRHLFDCRVNSAAEPSTPGRCVSMDVQRLAWRPCTVSPFTKEAAVGPELLDATKWLVELVEQQCGALAVLHIGGMDAHFQNQTIGVHQQMTFASQDLLSRIVAADSLVLVV